MRIEVLVFRLMDPRPSPAGLPTLSIFIPQGWRWSIDNIGLTVKHSSVQFGSERVQPWCISTNGIDGHALDLARSHGGAVRLLHD